MTLEERVTQLERMVAELHQRVLRPHAWLDQIYGRYKDGDPFLEAMRLGSEYRKSLRPRSKKVRSKGKPASKR